MPYVVSLQIPFISLLVQFPLNLHCHCQGISALMQHWFATLVTLVSYMRFQSEIFFFRAFHFGNTALFMTYSLPRCAKALIRVSSHVALKLCPQLHRNYMPENSSTFSFFASRSNRSFKHFSLLGKHRHGFLTLLSHLVLHHGVFS